MTQIIAIVSFKGGSGKSSVTAGLAAGLAAAGKKVLAIDADPQGGLGAALGLQEADWMGTTWDLLGRFRLGDCLVDAHGFQVIPADLRLAGAELSTSSGWQDRLRDRLEGETGRWDFVLIDSAPGLGVLPFVALRAAQLALIVCPQDYMSIRVLPHVLNTCERAQTPVMGLVPTMTGSRTRHETDAGVTMADEYGELPLLPEIPRRVAVQDAALSGQPVQSYEPASDASAAFARLTERIIQNAR